MSDIAVPSQFNLSIHGSSGLTSVIFHDAFVSANGPSVSTCGRGATEINVTSPGLEFQIPFEAADGRIVIDAAAYGFAPSSSVPRFLANLTYFFPADFGTWQVDDLTQGPSASGAGLAFSYTSCIR